jgi:putrescine transport system substrate-binding protein
VLRGLFGARIATHNRPAMDLEGWRGSMIIRRTRIAGAGALLATVLALLLGACAGPASPPGAGAAPAAGAGPATGAAPADEEKLLNVYNWSDYIDPAVVPAFEKEYGIKVNYDVFDSNEVVETKLLAGKTGYDVVVPSASFMQRQIVAGVFQKLDKTQLPNLHNLDPDITRRIEVYDPGGQYGVNYLWGTSGIGYNVDAIARAMPGAPVDSFAMLFDPQVVRNFQQCGVSILDAPDEVVGSVLVYLGRNPNSEAPEDLKAAEQVLLAIRPYVRYINSSKYIEDLANGEICLAMGWSGDIGQARARARDAGGSVTIRYSIARQGAIMFFDMLAIPADAVHVRNAHLFINYLLRPDIAARNSGTEHYATGNAAAYPLIDPAVHNDRSIYPAPEQMVHLYANPVHSLAYTRELNRTWTRFKTGR